MRMFLFWLSRMLPYRVINDGETPYLERYYLCTMFGWRFYLHQFVGSDPARGLHDHPWRKAYSLILSGWYWEENRTGGKRVSWFNSLTGDSFHRVVLPRDWSKQGDGRPCWTLFFHTAGDVKPWGFLRPPAIQPSFPKPGYLIFEPYTYDKEGSQKEWWKTAPKRKDASK